MIHLNNDITSMGLLKPIGYKYIKKMDVFFNQVSPIAGNGELSRQY
jgi:hypothetical protein